LNFPYQLITFESQGEHFHLFADSIDEGTAATKQYGILNASFRAYLEVSGISANISCDFTLGNLYDFYKQLKECCEKVTGDAILQDYASSKKTMFKVSFLDKTGHVDIDGMFVHYGTKNMVGFAFQTDQTYISPILHSLKCFFDALAKIQGFYDFPY